MKPVGFRRSSALPKAALKRPHSTRWRDHRGITPFAKRLECVWFTTAFRWTAVPPRLAGSGRNGSRTRGSASLPGSGFDARILRGILSRRRSKWRQCRVSLHCSRHEQLFPHNRLIVKCLRILEHPLRGPILRVEQPGFLTVRKWVGAHREPCRKKIRMCNAFNDNSLRASSSPAPPAVEPMERRLLARYPCGGLAGCGQAVPPAGNRENI